MCEEDGMEEWKECTLSNLGTIVGGATPSTKDSSNYENGSIAWITPKYLSTYTERFISHGERNITEKGLKSCSAQLMPPNSILFTSRAPIGYIAIAKNEVCTNQGFKSIVPNKDTDFMFLYYLLRYNKDNIENLGTGTTFKEVSDSTMKSVPVKVPPLPTQQKIAAILSSLDDKIELNNKINTNLEQQAGALFKNFSEKSSESVKFTDLIYILGGGTPKTNNEDYWNGKIPFFTPKDVGNPYCLLTEKKITESGLDNCNSRLYPVNTIFVTARGTVGKVCLAGLPMAMNQSCYALKSKEDNQLLAYFYTLEAINSLKHKANGATFDAIVTRDFETETINILSEQDTKEFTQIVKPIFEKILTNQKENINLSNLRDTLLPKLMNGDLETNHMGD